MLRTKADYTRHSWLLGMEAFETIRSYSDEAEQNVRRAVADAGLQLYLGRCRIPYDAFFDAMPPEHRAFFEQLELWFQNPDCICVHAGLDPHIPELSDQAPQSLIWGHGDFPVKYEGATGVVYGHWNNANLGPDGRPTPNATANTIGIDTISHGVLTAIRMPDRRVFQSDRHIGMPD
jgi:diadenosine tetraphosphatase ApaH/serine/threonine PP2A family protein phosphatase